MDRVFNVAWLVWGLGMIITLMIVPLSMMLGLWAGIDAFLLSVLCWASMVMMVKKFEIKYGFDKVV